MDYPTVSRAGIAFSVVPLFDVRHLRVAGIYLFEVADNRGSEVLYVGETCDLGTRLRPGHKQLETATARGMRNVLVHRGPNDKAARVRMETQLRGIFNPPENKQDSPIGDLLTQFYNKAVR